MTSWESTAKLSSPTPRCWHNQGPWKMDTHEPGVSSAPKTSLPNCLVQQAGPGQHRACWEQHSSPADIWVQLLLQPCHGQLSPGTQGHPLPPPHPGWQPRQCHFQYSRHFGLPYCSFCLSCLQGPVQAARRQPAEPIHWPGCRGLPSGMFTWGQQHRGRCPPHRAPCSPRAAARAWRWAAESSGTSPSPAMPSPLLHLMAPGRHPLTSSVFRASDCAPGFSLTSASRLAGLLAAAVGPCAATSSCCCGASSCAFFTSEPGPVSVVMAAGHPALPPPPTRRDRRCHWGAWGWRCQAARSPGCSDHVGRRGAFPPLPCCPHARICCGTPGSLSAPGSGFAKVQRCGERHWWQGPTALTAVWGWP